MGLAQGRRFGKRPLQLSQKEGGGEERNRSGGRGVRRGEAGPTGPSLMGCESEGKDGVPHEARLPEEKMLEATN